MTTHTFSDGDAVREVLGSDEFTPPTREDDGATLELRRSMARFAGPDDHAPRRHAVVEALANVDADAAATYAVTITDRMLAEPVFDAVRIARTAPVVALAAALGLVDIDDPATAQRLVDDVDRVAAVVGRGEPPDPSSDAATGRLLALASGHESHAVAVVSLLYQSLDATAALIATTLHALATGDERRAAVPRTVRSATRSAEVAGMAIAPGDTVVLELAVDDTEFGAGRHICPGRDLAVRITDSVVSSIVSSRLVVDLGRVAVDGDGRPIRLPLR
jgi:non-ribosomal peptide synthetase component F